MGNVIMKAQQIVYGASNVEAALNNLDVAELIELNKRMAAIDDWKANVHEVTYTGPELTINNALAVPARSLKTTIEAIQDLHGLPFPYVGGAYKNKLVFPYNDTTKTAYGITFTVNSDGTVTITGTATDRADFVLFQGVVPSEWSGMKFSGNPLAADTGIMLIQQRGGEWTNYCNSVYSDHEETINTIPIGTTVWVFIRIFSGKTVNATIKPMISTEGGTFAPWENKCPISGRTEARVDTENEDSTESAYAVIQLGTTVYGADINWDTGVATLFGIFKQITWGSLGKTVISNYTRGSVAIESAADYAVYPPTEGRPQLSNLAPYKAAFSEDSLHFYISTDRIQVFLPNDTDNSTVIQLYYELATPTTLQLTPTQLQMLKGYNRVTLADGYGEIELKALVLGGDV